MAEEKDVEMKDAEAVEKDKKVPDKKKQKKGEVEKDADLSEEDLELKNNLLMMVERISKENDPAVQAMALDTISNEIRTATTSMTSVPKPLKFLRPMYGTLKEAYERMSPGENRGKLADVISVLAMTTSEEGSRESLKYRLAGHTGGQDEEDVGEDVASFSRRMLYVDAQDEVGVWGHEYVRNLAGEIGQEYQARREAEQPYQDLLKLVAQIVPYHMAHNAEPEAVDLLLEVEKLEWLPDYVDEKNVGRTCLYLVSCCSYLAEPDDTLVLEAAYYCYRKLNKFPEAMCMCLKLGCPDMVASTMSYCEDPLVKKQLCYMLARQAREVLNFEEGEAAVPDAELRYELTEIMSNNKLSEHYMELARDLDVVEAKTPDEVYKMHLVEGRATTGPSVDSARHNLASSLVNAFVNAGYGQDKLMLGGSGGEATPGDGRSWIFNNSKEGQVVATAAIGMINMWDVDKGLPLLDPFLYAKEPELVAGALLGVGILCTGIVHENDPALAILQDFIEKKDQLPRLGAILGLALAYAGTRREEVAEALVPLVVDESLPIETAGHAALALGFVFVGSQHPSSTEAIVQALMARNSAELTDAWAKMMCLGLGLLFLGRQDSCDATLMVASTLNPHISRYCSVTLETCAYAGTGDVLKVQDMLFMCGEHINIENQGEGPDFYWMTAHQGPAVLGLALLAMAEDLGSHMANRALEHLLQYGDVPVRRAVPLAIAMLHVSNPTIAAMDALSRLSHDQDHEVAHNAIISFGIVGAGTNNARLAGMLRQLSAYYYKEPTLLCAVRMAQGLVHMGKGLLKLAPYHTEGQLVSGLALAGLLTVMHCCLEVKHTIQGKFAHMMYMLAAGMRPRMLMTIDEDGKMLPVSVRVGQAVDVVAQAGRPKTITGFQTHTTPVLLSVGERAELATSQYIALSSLLEGVVILKPNPDYVETHE